MQQDYRGHLIRVIETSVWSAELFELESGALLPTTVTATASEGFEVCMRRARKLIDLYLAAEAESDGRRHLELGAALRQLRSIRS